MTWLRLQLKLATRSSSSRRPVAAARACGWCMIQRDYATNWPAHAARPEPPSATTPYSWSGLFSPPATSRSRSWRTTMDRSCTLVSASAACNAGTRKIIEESPSILLTESRRSAMGKAAVEIARAVDYQGVGTVEFIVSTKAPDEFFFMEMNTRLQVEHPVTELVTGIDLVEQQLRLAAGEALSFGQDDIAYNGHAIEARVYAENPSRGFLPSGGDVLCLREPDQEGIRIDSSLVAGGHVGTTYDPMLSKVIAWGPDRETALARLDRALSETVILGFPTNITFLRSLLHHPEVQAGRLDTELVERDLPSLISTPAPPAAYVAFAMSQLLGRLPIGPVINRWDVSDGWRLGGPAAPASWNLAGTEGTTDVVRATGGLEGAEVTINGGRAHSVVAERIPDGLLLTIDGRTQRALVAASELTTWVWLDGMTFAMTELAPERHTRGSSAVEDEVRSPMPGTVIIVNVKIGDEVGEGEALLVVEAMKMEYTLVSPRAGRVNEVLAVVGQRVQLDAPLIHLDPVQVAS